MDRRAELKRLYREAKPEAGVYQIRNVRNGKVLIESTPNLKTITGRRIELQRGGHPNARLRADLQELGPDAFVVEVLQVVELKDCAFPRDALKELQAIWVDRLQPFGARGYHAPAREHR